MVCSAWVVRFVGGSCIILFHLLGVLVWKVGLISRFNLISLTLCVQLSLIGIVGQLNCVGLIIHKDY